jgi:signal transduction histidine kinase
VTLLNRGKTVTLEINDNGSGLSPDELTHLDGVASLGVGIAGMRERVRQLKGTFKINSIANGTQVLVSLPIDQEQHAAHIVSR